MLQATVTVQPEMATSATETTGPQASTSAELGTSVEGDGSLCGAAVSSPAPQTVILTKTTSGEKLSSHDVSSSTQPSLEQSQQAPSDREGGEKDSAQRQGDSSTSKLGVVPFPKSSLPEESKLPLPTMPECSTLPQDSAPQSGRAMKPGAYLTDEEVLGIRKSLIRHRHLGQTLILGSNVVAVYVQE